MPIDPKSAAVRSSALGRPPTLDDLVALTEQLEADDAQDRPALRQRDRQIGIELQPLRDLPAQQVVAWLDRVAAPAHTARGPLSGGKELLSFLMGFIALLLGLSMAVGALSYDGTVPINVVLAWLVLVGTQLLFLIVLALGAIFGGRHSGRLTVLQGVLRTFVEALLRLLPHSSREGWGRVLGREAALRHRYGSLRNWLLMGWLQLFAVVFNISVLVTLLAMLTFSDRAFAWSTTVGLTPQAMHRMTTVISAPWGWFIPAAAPTPEMVEATRYFRMPKGVPSRRDPAVFGGWWSFLIASVAAYGLLPRLLLFYWSHRRYQRALHRSIVQSPGVDLLLERLNRPLVETGAALADDQPRMNAPTSPHAITAQMDPTTRWTAINWSGVPLTDAQLADLARAEFGITIGSSLPAGGERSLEEDRATVTAAGELGGGVMLVVKAWEPPRGEIDDFLELLRSAIGKGRSILVLPVAIAGGTPDQPIDADRGIWQRRIARIGDPWLRVIELKGQHV